MNSSDSIDYELPPADSYCVDLAGLSDRERRAAVTAIEEIVGPLRPARGVDSSLLAKSAATPDSVPMNALSRG
jgi:hypothetical protein